jgi:hypothetical protein
MLLIKNIYINRLTKKNGLLFFRPLRHHGVTIPTYQVIAASGKEVVQG